MALAGSVDTYLGLTLSASTATGGLLYPPTWSLTAQILSALHMLYCVGFSYHSHHIRDWSKLRIYLVCGSVCHAGKGIGAAEVSWRHSLLTFEEAYPTVLQPSTSCSSALSKIPTTSYNLSSSWGPPGQEPKSVEDISHSSYNTWLAQASTVLLVYMHQSLSLTFHSVSLRKANFQVTVPGNVQLKEISFYYSTMLAFKCLTQD